MRQGHEDHFGHEGAQGDMPTPPQFAEVTGGEGSVEVLLDLDTDERANADRHVAETREITIDIEVIAGSGDENLDRGMTVAVEEEPLEGHELQDGAEEKVFHRAHEDAFCGEAPGDRSMACRGLAEGEPRKLTDRT